MIATTSTTYQREIVTTDLFDALSGLVRANHDETGYLRDTPFNPNALFYLAMESEGNLRCYTVRVDGQLVGYCTMFVAIHPHYGTKQATQDALFVDAGHRGGSAGARLIRFADEQLKREGFEAVYRQSSRRREIGRLLIRMGYEPVERLYGRRL